MEFPKGYLLFLVLPVALITARAVDNEVFDQAVHSFETEDSKVDLNKKSGSVTGTDEVGRWYNNAWISFTAYLSTGQTALGAKQHIKFDKVLLNDGDGYDPHTGIFRAPVQGVYQFTFFVGQRHANEIRANLMLDGEYVLGAIAEGVHHQQDVQGSNSAIIHLKKGQSVWVQAETGNHLEGNDGPYRYTSFSGHILYVRN